MGYMSLRVNAVRRGRRQAAGQRASGDGDDQDGESVEEPGTGHSGLRPGWAWSARTARLGLRPAARASAGVRCLLAAPAAARAALPARPGWHATARRAAAGSG